MVGGVSYSNDFPIVGGYDTTYNDIDINSDMIIAKFNENLTGLLASTFLGGSGGDVLYNITFDPITNNIFVAGFTNTIDYPTTGGGVYSNTLSGA